MAASPLGKRKDAPAADEGGGRPTFASVPDACWQIVGSFAAPPDAYNLSLSSKRFFRPGDAAVGVGSRVLVRDVRSMPELNGRRGVVVRNATKKGKVAGAGGRIPVLVDGMEQPVALKLSCATPPLLATTLLRRSLLSSLGRVLDRSPSGISLEAVLAMPEGALIAGSTVAQACLGVLWEGKYDEAPDVDVFTSAKAAPMVRSWLVEHANAMFGGFHDTYIDIADSRLLYTVDTKIHHVEKWGSIFQNIGENLEGMNRYSYGTKTAWSANGEGAEIALEALKNTEYYQSAIKWGKNCKSYADAKWKHTMCFDELGIDQNKAYSIKPRPGGDLPFDFNGDGSIDLIVGRIKTKEDGEKGYVSPFGLLEDFDLTICKASFDDNHGAQSPRRRRELREAFQASQREVFGTDGGVCARERHDREGPRGRPRRALLQAGRRRGDAPRCRRGRILGAPGGQHVGPRGAGQVRRFDPVPQLDPQARRAPSQVPAAWHRGCRCAYDRRRFSDP
ncbi:hypothetical protein ACHAWF_012803 [Thalassiosira exigua]